MSNCFYFSLDIEGDELDVLQTIPFDNMTIRTLTVEILNENISGSVEKLMSPRYETLNIMNLPNKYVLDAMFKLRK
jgi:hypothetical protein